jgi:hypothetical protein
MASIPLPELTITDPDALELAKKVISIYAQIKSIKELDAKARADLIKHSADIIKETEENSAEIVGKISFRSPDLASSIRVERYVPKEAGPQGALNKNQADTLKVMGLADLFERTIEVDKVDDPQALLDSMKAGGFNPWDYLEIKVKEGRDNIVAKHKGVHVNEVLSPKEGFLARLNEVWSKLSKPAIEYMTKYMVATYKLKAVVGK